MRFGSMQPVYVGIPIPEQEFGSNFHNPGKTDKDNNFIKQFASLLGLSASETGETIKAAVKMSDEQFAELFGKDGSSTFDSDLEGLKAMISAAGSAEELLNLLYQACENKQSLVEAGVFDVQSVFELIKNLQGLDISDSVKSQIKDELKDRIDPAIKAIKDILKQDEIDEDELRTALTELKEKLGFVDLAKFNKQAGEVLEGFYDDHDAIEKALKYLKNDLMDEVFAKLESIKPDEGKMQEYKKAEDDLKIESIKPSVGLVATNIMNRQQHASQIQQLKSLERQQKEHELEIKRLDRKRISKKNNEMKKQQKERTQNKNEGLKMNDKKAMERKAARKGK